MLTATPARGGPDRRQRRDPVAVLARRHDALCTQAVDPSEIAAGLEAAGVGDREARADYGVGNVFELAALMYDAVPRRPAQVDAADDPWRRPWPSHLMRGVLYAAPGLLYVLALRTVHAGVEVGLLVVAATLGAAAAAGVALLGHLLLGRLDARAAGVLLRWAVLGAGPLLGVLVAAGGLLLGAPRGVAVLGGVQIVYQMAATVLLVRRADTLLLVVLAPGVALAGAALAGLLNLPAPVLLATVALPVLLACGAAAVVAPREAAGPALPAALGRADLRLAGTHLAYGAVSAGLVSFLVIDVVTGRAPLGVDVVAPAMAPLVVSLGLAEWLVHRLRSTGRAALGAARTPREFRSSARTGLLLTALVYAVGLLDLTLLTGLGLVVAGGTLPPVLLLDAAACGVLGFALFLANVLLSLGRAGTVLVLVAAACTADLAGRLAPLDAIGTAAGHLAVFAVLAVLLLPLAAGTYGQVSRHR